MFAISITVPLVRISLRRLHRDKTGDHEPLRTKSMTWMYATEYPGPVSVEGSNSI
jgi:hypothetical protein